MSNQRRLGRGLEALLGRSLDEPVPDALAGVGGADAPLADSGDDAVMTRDEDGQQWLDLGVIEPNPFQPRKAFDEEEIADLADSIREHGVLQPLNVRRIDGRFELIAGERRLRAAQAAGWKRVPVRVRNADDRETAELALVENLQRKDLNPIEKAESFQRYLADYDCTQEDLAKRVQINRSTVANLIRLLELPERVKRMVVDGDLSQGHARALLALPQSDRESAAERVCREGLSVRKTEELAQDSAPPDSEDLRVVGEDGVSRKPTPTRSEQLAALETELQAALGTKVELKQNRKGAGRITVHFASIDEFERLRGLLTGAGEGSSEAVA